MGGVTLIAAMVANGAEARDNPPIPGPREGQAKPAAAPRPDVAAMAKPAFGPVFGPDRRLFDGAPGARPAPRTASRPGSGPAEPELLSARMEKPAFGRDWKFFDLDDEDEASAPPSGRRRSIAREKNAFRGDFGIVAVGAVAMPNYEGANETSIKPAAALAGRIGGVSISPRAAGLALDFIEGKKGAKINLNFGPVVRYRMNRSGTIKDPVVARLGKLSSVVEGGVAFGATIKRVLHRADQMSIGADVRWDLSGKGSGKTITPTISYLSPVSRAIVVGGVVSAEFVDRAYARYNYDVTPAGSVASGLPVYTARGGMKSFNVGGFIAHDLNNNLMDGGLALGAGVMYSRLTGSAAETPITRMRGRRSQWTFALGLSYTF